jgi:uncharacterized protein YhbP (UPF0306 family)
MYNNNERLSLLIGDYLRAGKLLHLYCSSNNVLWMCHVWYAVGSCNQELIFTSNKARRHSKEINNNPIIAGGVNAMDLDGLGQKVQGLSFEGKAEEATGNEIEKAYELYAMRWPQVKSMFSANDIQSGRVDMRMYRVTITRAVLFDEVNYPDNPRQEILY